MCAIQPPTQPALAICKLVFNSSVAVRAVGGDPDQMICWDVSEWPILAMVGAQARYVNFCLDGIVVHHDVGPAACFAMKPDGCLVQEV